MPSTTAHPQTWRRSAACLHSKLPPRTWDDHCDEETPQDRELRHRHAEAVCSSCPVTAACAADVGRYDAGIRGGRLLQRRDDDTPPTKRGQRIARGDPCSGCGAPLWPSRAGVPVPPGLARHSGRGLCSICSSRKRRRAVSA